MTHQDIRSIRLSNEQLIGTKFKTPAELVRWFGAVQSQDFPGAKWALGQRLGLSNEDLDQAFNSGSILRTHIMRPTWHFVHPEDLVWMQALCAPRVKRVMNYYNKRLGLDEKVLDRTNKIIADVLGGKNYKTRLEIKKILEEGGISASTQKLGHIMAWAELDAIICSGPRLGKQFTYALVSEQTANCQPLTPKNPLAELAIRYFQSHGPATVKDFVWWSGLITSDARRGIEAASLKSENVDGKQYWFVSPTAKSQPPPPNLYLLPNYDEYTIAYQDRDVYLNPNTAKYFKNQGNAAFWNAIVYKGEIIGMWKREVEKKSVIVKTQFFNKLTASEKLEFEKTIKQYTKFLNLKVETNL